MVTDELRRIEEERQISVAVGQPQQAGCMDHLEDI